MPRRRKLYPPPWTGGSDDDPLTIPLDRLIEQIEQQDTGYDPSPPRIDLRRKSSRRTRLRPVQQGRTADALLAVQSITSRQEQPTKK
jgi:hypothetical protein